MFRIDQEKCPKRLICSNCYKVSLKDKEIYYYCLNCDEGGTFPEGRNLDKNDLKFFRRILKEFSHWKDDKDI